MAASFLARPDNARSSSVSKVSFALAVILDLSHPRVEQQYHPFQYDTSMALKWRHPIHSRTGIDTSSILITEVPTYFVRN
jgi:hypothetical protein